MIGQSISHYRIIGQLGSGGMGVVYKAEDTNLDRTVALKFLAAHLLESEEHKQRFLRGQSHGVARSPQHLRNLGNVGPFLTASADGHTILYWRLDSSVEDLMLVENFR